MTSSNRNIFRVTGHLCGEFTCDRWISRKGQWRGTLMFSLICTWINGWINIRQADILRRHRAHYDVIAMKTPYMTTPLWVSQIDLYLRLLASDSKNHIRHGDQIPLLLCVLHRFCLQHIFDTIIVCMNPSQLYIFWFSWKCSRSYLLWWGSAMMIHAA